MIFDSFLDALVCRADDLALAVELFDAVGGPAGDSCDCKEGSVELHGDSEHRINEAAVEVDVGGNALVDLALCGDEIC